MKSLKNRTFLATTALDEFWDTSQPMLFLGEWCKTFNQKTKWENLDAEVLILPDLEHSNSYEAYKHTVQVYENLLPKLANWLNRIHQVEYSLKYWRTVIGPFLLWYVQIVYHRFSCLKTAFALYPDLTTIGLSPTSYKTPLNTREFYMFASESDAWNLQIITQLLDLSFKSPVSYMNFSWTKEIQQRKEIFEKELSYKKMTKIKINFLRIFAKWRSSKVVGLCVCVHEFSRMNLLKLIFKSGFRILPMVQVIGDNQPQRKISLDLPLREEIASLFIEDEFSKLILQTLKINMPLNFIESYKEESKLSEKCYPYNPGVIVSTGWMQHDSVKLWGAKQAEQNTKLINIQHGGAYGVAKYFTSELLERQNCDRFISWGWQDGAKVIQAPSILVSERISERKLFLRNNKKNNNSILWAATDAVRFPPFIGSYLSYMQQTYFDWQSRFANTLSAEVSSQVVMRLRPASPHFNYVQELLPNLKIHRPNERSSFFEQLYSSKILISDNFHTTFLYGLAFNIPTILFWDKKLWKLREEVKMDFKALHEVGIYHESPESAAEMLNKIANDPNLWWHKKDVQLVRKKFSDKFASTSNSWLNEWVDILLSCNKIASTPL